MTEKQIRDHAIKELEKMGYKWWWYPTRPHFTAREWDILGIYDIVGVRKNKLIFVQYTSKSNMGARVKKIMAAFSTNGEYVANSWVWGWDKINKKFHKIKILK